MRRLAHAALIVGLGFSGIAQAADFQAGVEAVKRGDYATALSEFKPLAIQGMPGAQTNLGLMYSKGWGVIKDDAYAFKWYRLAADQGHPVAQNNLGAMYIQGLGGPRDPVFGLMWLMLAADGGYPPAKDSVRTESNALTQTQVLIAKQMALLWKEKQGLNVASR